MICNQKSKAILLKEAIHVTVTMSPRFNWLPSKLIIQTRCGFLHVPDFWIGLRLF